MTVDEALAVAYAQEKLRSALNDGKYKAQNGLVLEQEVADLVNAYKQCRAVMKANGMTDDLT